MSLFITTDRKRPALSAGAIPNGRGAERAMQKDGVPGDRSHTVHRVLVHRGVEEPNGQEGGLQVEEPAGGGAGPSELSGAGRVSRARAILEKKGLFK